MVVSSANFTSLTPTSLSQELHSSRSHWWMMG